MGRRTNPPFAEEGIMVLTDNHRRLRVELASKGCEVPEDQRTRLQRLIEPLGEAVKDFPNPELWLKVIFHENRGAYHVEAKLKLPGRTHFTGDNDPHLDSALARCLRKLQHRVESNPEVDRGDLEQAWRRDANDRKWVAAAKPEDPDTGPIGRAVQAGDYKAFRTLLVGYEDWLRTRVGRWLQRYPEAQAQVGGRVLIGDLVEEVYLNAFEELDRKPAEVSLSSWLDSLIDRSLREVLQDPDEEHANASMARTLRETQF
jgi:hypothetical protein